MNVKLAAVIGLLFILLVPFSVTPIPPLLDYPDHMAEMFVIAHLPLDQVLSRVYDIHWTVVANSGFELLLPPLLHFVPLWTLGKAALVLSLTLPLIGAAMFSRAAFGCWSAWPAAGGLVAFNVLFLLGFMNFLLGLGLSLLAAAGWVTWRGRRPAATIFLAIPTAVILFFVHLFGLFLFALLIGGHELVALTGPPGRRFPSPTTFLRRVVPDALPFVLPAILLFTSTLAGTDSPTMRLPLKVKLGELTYPFLTYFQTPDRILTLAVLAVVAALLLTRRARLAPPAVITGVILLAIWPFVPHIYKSTGYIDARFPIMMGYLLFAGFQPARLSPRLGWSLAVGIAMVITVRCAAVAAVWAGHNADLAELSSVIAKIEPGSQVLAVDVPNAQVTPYWLTHRRNWLNAAYIKTYYHDAALLIPERHAFWPRLFTGFGKQPVIVRPAYLDVTAPEGELPDYHQLTRDTPAPDALADAPYLPGWQRKFDYVLLLAAGAAPEAATLAPGKLQLIALTEFVALYRVRKP